MGALLALASAVCYGAVDFAGGLLSRRVHFTVVTFLGQVGGLLFAVVVAALVPAETVRPSDAVWGTLSGVGSGTAMHFLNRGLSRGAMSIVVPVSAVTGVALSVLSGVFLLGDQPTGAAWLGICLTLPALWLVSGGSLSPRSGRGREGGVGGRADRQFGGGPAVHRPRSGRPGERSVARGPPGASPPSCSCYRAPGGRLPGSGSPGGGWVRRSSSGRVRASPSSSICGRPVGR